MKIILDERDKEIIEKYRSGEMYEKYGLSLPLISEHSKKCSLELKINDPYKCGVVLAELFHRLRDFEKEECGFEITAVSLMGVHSDYENIKEDVLNAVNEAFRNRGL